MKNDRHTIEMIRQVATAKGRKQLGLFSIEGTRLHERAIRAGWEIDSAVIAPTYGEKEREQAVLGALSAASATIITIPQAEVEKLTGGRDLGLILGLVRPKHFPTWHDLLSSSPAILLIAVDIIDPGNIGSLIRSAHGLGAKAFIAVGGSDPFHPKAVRTSMGSIFKLPVLWVETWKELRPILDQYAMQTVGAVTEGGIPLPHAHYPEERIAVVLGNEFEGLSAELTQQLDQPITIPMVAGIDSLSVTSAAAIILYDLYSKISWKIATEITASNQWQDDL